MSDYSIPVVSTIGLGNGFNNLMAEVRDFLATGQVEHYQDHLKLIEIINRNMVQYMGSQYIVGANFDYGQDDNKTNKVTFNGIFLKLLDYSNMSDLYLAKVIIPDDPNLGVTLEINPTSYEQKIKKLYRKNDINSVLRFVYDLNLANNISYQAHDTGLDVLYTEQEVLDSIKLFGFVDDMRICQWVRQNGILEDKYPIGSGDAIWSTDWIGLLHRKFITSGEWIMSMALNSESEALCRMIMQHPHWREFVDLAISRNLIEPEGLIAFFDGWPNEEAKQYILSKKTT